VQIFAHSEQTVYPVPVIQRGQTFMSEPPNNLPKLATPARWALTGANITTLEELS